MPAAASQIWISPNRAGVPPPATSSLPSVENASERMRSESPARRRGGALPSSACTSTSRFPETASDFPSGENASAVITGGCV